MRLLIICKGRLAGDAQQHGRHPEGHRDLSRRRLLGFLEFHVGGRKPHRFPVEPALEQHRPPRIAVPLEGVLQFALQPLELVGAQRGAVLAVID